MPPDSIKSTLPVLPLPRTINRICSTGFGGWLSKAGGSHTGTETLLNPPPAVREFSLAPIVLDFESKGRSTPAHLRQIALAPQCNAVQTAFGQASQRRDCKLIFKEDVARQALHVLRGHAPDSVQYLIERELPAEEYLLPR